MIDNREQESELASFPVMVRLDSTRFDYSLTDGSDLRFFDEGGREELFYEIERWDQTGDSIIWVRVPRIDAGSHDYIWMYWGGGTSTEYLDAAAVWSDYELVYHFDRLIDSDDDPATRPDRVVDSGPRGNDGTAFAPNEWAHGDPVEPGVLGDGFRLKNAAAKEDKQYICTNYQSPGIPEAWTIEVWVKGDDSPRRLGDSSASNGPIMGHHYYNIVWDDDENPGGIIYTTSPGNEHADLCLGGTGLNSDTWYYLAGVYDSGGETVCGYRDGRQWWIPDTSLAAPLEATSRDVFLGSAADYGSVMNGVIDEVRVANVARSSDWIAAQYLSMTDRLLTFGEVEQRE
jgi:hypothetical protein